MEIKFANGDYKLTICLLAYEKLKMYANKSKNNGLYIVGFAEREDKKNSIKIIDFAVPKQVGSTSTQSVKKEDIENLALAFSLENKTITNAKSMIRVLCKLDNYGKVTINTGLKTDSETAFKEKDWYVIIAFNKAGDLDIILKDVGNDVDIINPSWDLESSGLIDEDEIKSELELNVSESLYSGTTSTSNTTYTSTEEPRKPIEMPPIREMI